MPDLLLITFYGVFLSQIFLLSYYYPNKLYQRMRYVAKTYPPSKYPKLYPNLLGSDADDIAKTRPKPYRYINMAIMVAGLLLLVVAMRSDYYPSGEGEETFVFLFAMLQFLPFIYLEFSECKQLKLMRDVNKASKRKAELEPRHFFGFVSPSLFGIAVILFFAALWFNFYIKDYDLSWARGTLTSVLALIGIHLYFAALFMWQVYGKKINPHETHKDRRIHRGVVVRVMVYTSIGLSVLMITVQSIREYNLDYLEPLIMSIYFQILAVIGIGTILHSNPIENIDFDVYKENV
ncbi:MAG: hypothetical protein K9G26_10775 [Emcibacter sp.]|nr:hypothetical protein [Emcibacter sp.]